MKNRIAMLVAVAAVVIGGTIVSLRHHRDEEASGCVDAESRELNSLLDQLGRYGDPIARSFTVYLAVRHCIALTWENNKDEFCYPIDKWMLDEEFKSDCLVFALFDNVVKSADGVNHWIPFTEEEVGAKSCFKSHFMSDFINGRASCPHAVDKRRVEGNASYQSELELSTTPPNPVNPVNPVEKHSAPLRLCARENISPAARAVLDAGCDLWRYYHVQPGANPNASYYDIRAHFQGCKPNGAMNAKSSDATYNELISALRTAHKALAAQIAPKVYEYGFLKR